MIRTPSGNNTGTGSYGIPLYLALIVAGLVGNYFPFSILNAHFIFGSIFAMLALQLYGLVRGVVAAAIISAFTFLAWNHPWGIVIFTSEVLVAGLLIRSRRIHLVIADMLYWLFIGIPLGYVCLHTFSNLPASNTLFLMTKQTINGIANVLVARLIFTGYLLRSKRLRVSFQEVVSNLLVFFVLCATLIMLTVQSRVDFSETDRQIRSALIHDSRNAAAGFDDWLTEIKAPIIHLAHMAETLPPAQIQTRMEQARLSNANFLRIALIDKAGVSVAYSPLFDDLHRNNIGKDFSDRPYIPLLKEQLKPMLSQVLVSHAGIPGPIAIMLAPVVWHGEYNGAVGGILNFNKIRHILKISSIENDLKYTLLDNNGHVILTNRKDQAVMAPFFRAKGTLKRLDKGIWQWIPELPFNTSTIELWGQSLYVAQFSIGDPPEWKLILEQPVAPFQKKLHDQYTAKFFMLFVFVVVSLVLAELLGRRIGATTENLALITRDLPAKAMSGSQIAWPQSGILETDHLIGNFREMAESLTAKFIENRQINETLEQRVEERTEALHTIEAQLSNAMKIARLGYWEYDVASDHFTFNDHFYAIFHTSADRVGGYSMSSTRYAQLFVHPDDRPVVGVEIQKALESTDPNFSSQLEHRVLYADGGIGYISVRFFIVKDNQGNTVKTYGANQDITERKRMEEELLKMQTLESLGILAGGLAHDFNNILTAITGNLSLAKLEAESGTHPYKYIEEAEKATQRATNLTQQLLTFAKGGAPVKETASLAEVVRESSAFALIGSKVRASFLIAEDLWPAEIDVGQMNQVISNLVINADQAMPEGGVIEIEAQNMPASADPALPLEPGKYIRIRIKDQGIGIAEKHLTKIFDPYFTTKQKGSGLGLATVYSIIKKHDGHITAESETGVGTVFTIYLPASEKPVPETKRMEAADIRGQGRILIMDDEETIRNLLEKSLTRLGYEVELTADGDEAVVQYEKALKSQTSFDAVILDLTIPGGMGGKECIRKLKEMDPDVKAIVASGYADDPVMANAADYGFTSAVAKPFSIQRLGQVLRQVLAN